MRDLKDLLSRPGPFASVALSTPSRAADASDQMALRWRNARQTLESTGLPPDELDRMEATVEGLTHAAGAAVVVLQSAGGPAFVEHPDDALKSDLAVVDELPRLGPVLESRQRSLPHLVVTTDRTGADLVGFGADDEPQVAAVDGEELHIHRGHQGGWSQRRFQQRAENLWEANAGEVAEAVTAMAHRLGVRLIAVAGDVRAVTFLVDQLPGELGAVTTKLEGQSPELIAEETVRVVADVVATDTRDVLERFKDELSQDLATSGPGPTLEALSAGRVQTLLVHDDPGDDRRARFDRQGLWCAQAGDTPSPPDAEEAEGRLVDVAVRSALLGDAEIRFVPRHNGPDDALGARLRW